MGGWVGGEGELVVGRDNLGSRQRQADSRIVSGGGREGHFVLGDICLFLCSRLPKVRSSLSRRKKGRRK